MSDDLQLQRQIDITQTMLSTLNAFADTLESISSANTSQLDLTNNMTETLRGLSQNINAMGQSTSASVDQLQNMINRNMISFGTGISRNNRAAYGLNQINQNAQATAGQSRQVLAGLSENVEDLQDHDRRLQQTNDALEENAENMRGSVGRLEDVTDELEESTRITDLSAKGLGVLNGIKDAVVTGGTSLILALPKLAFYGGLLVAKASFYIVASMAKFVKFTMTLPFTISSIMVEIGNKLREDLTSIKSAGEEAKEAFDLTSRIGQGAVKLTNWAKGSMKIFQTPRSEMAKLFDMGTAGLAAVQSESFKLTSAMGHYAEIYGGAILSDIERVKSLVKLTRGLGINAEDVGYYAMEAFNQGTSPEHVLLDVYNSISHFAGKNDLDKKALSNMFVKVRKDIVSFGHLTNFELSRVVAKLRNLKVSTEDAMSLFKKVSTFEEAAKTSTMLFQSFGMNIDALDLLMARDPADMLIQFRDAMFFTGKAFKNLDRHERSLMQSITGISEQSLSSLFNYMELGFTKDEAMKLLEKKDPTKEHIKLIKGLTSTIKQFQKIMQFSSPFEAFYQGLITNALGHKELDKSLLDFSKVYEDIRHLGFTLDLSNLEGMITPIVGILNGVRRTFINEEFFGLLRKTTQLVGHFIDGISYDLQKDGPAKQFYIVKYQYESYLKLIGQKAQDKLPEFKKQVLEGLKENIKEEISGMSAPLKEYLTKRGVLQTVREEGKEIYKVSSKATADHIYATLTSAAAQFAGSQTNLEALNKVISSEIDGFEQTINEGSLLTDAMSSEIQNELNKKVDSITSIDGRVGSLVDGMLELFKEGSPHFQRLFDIGRNITKGVLIGAIKGATILFRILAGGSDVLVSEMGLDKDIIGKLAKERGIEPENFTVYDYMGVKKKDMDSLVDELSGETTSLVSRLPTMFSMASGLIADLGSVFVEFGEGFAKGIAGTVFDYVSSFNNIIQELVFIPAGLDPVKLSKAKSGQLFEGKVPKSKEDFDQAVVALQDSGFVGSRGVTGEYLTLYENYKKSLKKDSAAFKFLELDEIKKAIKVLSDSSNYDSKYNPFDDAEIFVRSSAIMTILNEAKKIDNSNTPDKQLNTSRSIIKEKVGDASASQLESKFKDMSIGDILQTVRYTAGGYWIFGGNNVQAELRELNKLKEEFFSSAGPQEVKDFEILKGKGIFIYTPQGIFKLDDNDSLYATKEGGYWNKIFLKISENFGNFVSHIEEKVFEYENNATRTFLDLTLNIEKAFKKILSNIQNTKNVLTDIKIKTSNVVNRLSKASYLNILSLQKTIERNTHSANQLINTLTKESLEAKSIIHEVNNLYESNVNTLIEEEEATYDDIMELIGLCTDVIQTISSKKPIIKKPKLAYY